MAAFTYRAMDRSGRSETGVLEAASAAAARQDLRARGLFPVQVSATRDAPQAANRGWALRSSVSARDLTVLTRQIATLIGSGVRIDEALQIAAGQANPRVAPVLLEMRAAVRDGQSFERALSAHPKVFSDYYRASVQAGEQSGQLEEVMGHLATFVDNRARNGQTIQLALLYPALLAFVSVGIITMLMAYVLPDIVRVFTSRGADLPWLTRALILLSDALRDWGLMAIAGLAVAVVGLRQLLRRPANRFAVHKWLATSRLTARIVTRINAAQFSGTLATLVQKSGAARGGVDRSRRRNAQPLHTRESRRRRRRGTRRGEFSSGHSRRRMLSSDADGDDRERRDGRSSGRRPATRGRRPAARP